MSTYVYAITRGAHPLDVRGRTGVGESPAPLRVVSEKDVAAVVSDAPENLRPKRRDLEAHQAVLEGLMADGAVLPMRFGMLAADDVVIERELAAHAEVYGGLLTDLDGRAEFNIKAVHREDAVLREILTGDDELRRMNEALRDASGGDPQERLGFGERVAVALEERRQADAQQLLAVLRPHAVRESVGPPLDGAFVNVSFLVDGGAAAGLEATVAKLREEIGWLMELNLYGPLPPYSFVDLSPDQGRQG